MPHLQNIVISSEKRKKLLLLLSHGPCSWDEIKTTMNVTATGMLPQVKILEDEGLVCREGKVHKLTDLGKLIVHHLSPLDATISTIETQKQFWQTHDIGALPPQMLQRIGELKDTWIIETSIEDSFEPHTHFIGSIPKSKKMAVISPIVHPVYPEFFLSFAERGQDAGLILTRYAFEKIRKEYHDMLIAGLQYRNARLSIFEKELRFASVVTDINFSISMFHHDGIFDSKRDLVSTNPSSIRWGESLFTWYLNQSRPVNKEGKY